MNIYLAQENQKTMIIDTKHSRYFVDTQNKTITGGIFQDESYSYENISPVMVGGKAKMELSNRRLVVTSTIEKVRSVGDKPSKEEYEM